MEVLDGTEEESFLAVGLLDHVPEPSIVDDLATVGSMSGGG